MKAERRAISPDYLRFGCLLGSKSHQPPPRGLANRRAGLRAGAIFLCLLIAVSSASRGESRDTLSLNNCVDRAEQCSLRLKEADDAMRKAKLAHAELTTSGLPSFVIGSGASFAPASRHFGYDPAMSNEGQLNGQVFVAQSLYDGGSRRLRSKQLGLEFERLAAARRALERDLRYNVEQGFIEGLRAQEEIKVQRENTQRMADYFGIVSRLASGGAASPTDVMKTQIELVRDSLSLQKAEESATVAKYELAELMGAPGDTSFELHGPLAGLIAFPPADTGGDGGADTASNLDTRISEITSRASLIDIDLSKRERRPVIALFADAGLLTSVSNLRIPRADRASMIGYSAGVTLQMPLFGWGANKMRTQQRQIVSDSLRLETRLLGRAAALEIRRTKVQLANLKKRLDSIRANIQVAKDNYLLTKAKFSSGTSLSLEVVDAHQLLSEAKLAELEALAEEESLASTLERLTSR